MKNFLIMGILITLFIFISNCCSLTKEYTVRYGGFIVDASTDIGIENVKIYDGDQITYTDITGFFKIKKSYIKYDLAANVADRLVIEASKKIYNPSTFVFCGEEFDKKCQLFKQ